MEVGIKNPKLHRNICETMIHIFATYINPKACANQTRETADHGAGEATQS